MKVRLKAQLTGTRDGVAWPAPGETVDLPDHEGAKLCASGVAEPVESRKADVETATPKASTETRKAPAKKTAAKKSAARRKR